MCIKHVFDALLCTSCHFRECIKIPKQNIKQFNVLFWMVNFHFGTADNIFWVDLNKSFLTS